MMHTFGRDQPPDVSALVEHVLMSDDGLDLWWAFKDALALSVGATTSSIYIHDDSHRHPGLRQIYRHERADDRVYSVQKTATYQMGSALVDATHSSVPDEPNEGDISRLAIRCFRSGSVTLSSISQELTHMAFPVFELTDGDQKSPPMAVCILGLPVTDDEADRARRSRLLGSYLPQLHPFALYARSRYLLPDVRRVLDTRATPFYDLLDDLLKMICDRLGFSYALISLVDEEAKEVRAIRGRNVNKSWLNAARHPLSSNDVVADVIRRGRSEVFHPNNEPDPRFDREIFQRFGHNDLERIFVPLGKTGVLEAGWRRQESRALSTVMQTALEHWAIEVASVLEWKWESERQREATNTLSRILQAGHDISELPRMSPRPNRVAHLDQFLEALAEKACSVLQSQIAIIYPVVPEPASRFTKVDPSELTFLSPIVRGRPLKGKAVLEPPKGKDNMAVSILRDFVRHGTKPRYITDAQSDSILSPVQHRKNLGNPEDPRELAFSFTEKQAIRSFAGVVLEAYGDIIGVLCLNYTKTRTFSRQERYIVETFVQHAMDMLSSDRLAMLRERRKIRDELHDSVRSRLSTLLLDVDTLSVEQEHRAASDSERARVLKIANVIDKMDDEIQEMLRDYDGDVWSGISLEASPQENGLAEEVHSEVMGLIPFEDRRLDIQISDDLPNIPKDERAKIVRIVGGMVSNAIRHSMATHIRVEVSFDDFQLDIFVTDDGVGFDEGVVLSSSENQASPRLGLPGMRRRAQELGATLEFDTRRNGGTQCHLTVPMTVIGKGNSNGN